MIAELKPTSKQLVYDLVSEAGVDTSDWANFKGEHPSSNPKYCYDWAFWDVSESKVVLCLWFSQMKESGGAIFQELNYRNLASLSTHRDPSDGVRAKRASRMDQAFSMAVKRKLPVRVIVVDGLSRGEDGADFSEVERRMLDPATWSVVSYDADTGACRIERGSPPAGRSFLLTWGNFEETSDSEIEDIARKLEQAQTVKGQWSSGNRKDIHAGERVFLLRQGSEAPGLVGWGTVSEEPFEDDHWDPARRQRGVKAKYIMVSWREVVPKDAGITRARLLELGVPESLLNAQGSGVLIPDEIAHRIEEAWREQFQISRKALSLQEVDSSESHCSSKLTRIAYNSSGWKRPTGDAKKYETRGTYNYEHGFGHEDWLFRNDWLIDGWRYAFIQGLNNHFRIKYLGTPLDLTLYTIEPDKRRRLVATIYGLESLSDEQAKSAVDAYKTHGWLKMMHEEATAVGGLADALGDPMWAEHVLNVRFRLENVVPHPPGTYLSDGDAWIKARHRYMLYNFEDEQKSRIEQLGHTRGGSQDAPETHKLFRRGTKPVEYTPEHNKMQAKLMAELKSEYGEDCVWREQDYVDVRVENDRELIYFEIKTDLDPRAVIRQALGQILEYAYHPMRTGRRPDKLVIVGRTVLGPEDTSYLAKLCEQFSLPLSYRIVSL